MSLLQSWMRLRRLLSGVALVPLLISAAAGAAESAPAFDRGDFGRNDIPVWSQLTEFEKQTIQRFPDARDGDADALLALYLLASGDVRSREQFEALRGRIEQRLAPIEAELEALAEPRERARRLHRLMFERFLEPASGGDVLSNYDAGQSQLTELIETRTYNCISSALLYTALAQRLGLDARGVLLPSHAFVEIELPGGATVEVETTSLQGFDRSHDQEFYESGDNDWFEARNLEPPSYADYLDRDIVSAAGLGLENMWNQHAQQGRLDYRARMRLAEIKGHLQPDNHRAQINRLLFYSREFTYLDANDESVALMRLFDRIAPYLASMEQIATSQPAAGDREFRTLLAWVQSARANTRVRNGMPERGLSLARRYLLRLDDDAVDAERIRHNLYLSLGHYARRKAATGEFTAGREAYDGIEAECTSNERCAQGMTELYSAWAQHHWQAGDWDTTTDIYQEYLALNIRSDNAQVMRDNLETAYLNWANRNWLDENREGAVQRLRECEQQLAEAPRCRSRRREMETALYRG